MTYTQPNTTPVAAILDRLEEPGYTVDEMTFLAYGDDLLDFCIGFDSYAKNRWLLDCEPLPSSVYEGDVVCVGSGPSLDDNLQILRQIQDQVLIVAAHSAITKLLDNGIIPHLITPKERLPDAAKIPKPLPDSIVYAGLPVVQYAPRMCQRHYLVGDSGYLAEWMGFHRSDIKITTTSGSLSVWVASVVARGTIWLVGHDMVFGHYKGFNFPEETAVGLIDCVDGIQRPSNWVYRSCREEFGRLAAWRDIIQTAPHGASIPYARQKRLEPRLSTKPVFNPRSTSYEIEAHPKLGHMLPMFDRVIKACEVAKNYHDMDLKVLFAPEDTHIGHTLMQPIWIQYSILRRTLGLTDDQCTIAMRESILNAFKALRPWAETMTDVFA